MRKQCWARGGLKEEDGKRVGLLTGGMLQSRPLHSTFLRPRTLKWRVRTNSSGKAVKSRGEVRTGQVAVLNEIRSLVLINQTRSWQGPCRTHC